jgi:hypothetical protein
MGTASLKFDRQLFTLKLGELAHQMQAKSVASDAKASAASRTTGGSMLLNIVDGQLALLSEWLERVDRICREVWQIQGEALTPEFVRDILAPEAMTIIGARHSTVSASVTSAVTRTGGSEGPYPAQHHLVMEINRLKGEVSNRYEIEVRELEYRRAAIEKEVKLARGRDIAAVRARLMERSIKATELADARFLPEADDWQNFQREFRALGNEEQQIERAQPKDRLLRAYCSYKEHPEVWETGKPEQGLFCLLGTPPHGIWTISDGVNENFQARFRALAARAGRALGAPSGSDPEDFWLHRLWLNLRGNDSDQLFAASNEGGVILSGCVASATFCSRLEKQALHPAEPVEASFNQAENAGNAILQKRARIAEIERTLDRPPVTEYRGQPVHGGQTWRFQLEEERQHLLIALAELERELGRSPAGAAESSRAQNSANSAQSVESKSTKGATAIGRNIDRLRKECGWSLDKLAKETGIDKKSILSHVNKGARPIPRILKEYAQAFTKALGQRITAPDLEK